MDRHPDTVLLSSSTLFEGRFLRLMEEKVELPSGLQQELVVVDHPGAVCIAPILASGELLLVRQYRHAVGDWLEEIPAGRLEANEERPAAAHRELEEETGFRAGRLELACEFFPAPGFCAERMSLYFAYDLESVPGGGLPQDEDEEFELVRRVPQAILRSGNRDAKTLLAASLLLGRG